MEGDAGTSRLNPTDSDTEEVIDHDTEEVIDHDTADHQVGHGRLSSRGVAAVAAVLVVLAAALAVAGYLLLQWNARSEQIQRDGAVALQAAKDCVTATQAPDTASMGAAQVRIIDCSTGDFGAQAVFYSSMLTEAYQAANVQVEVADLRAAVERHHDDGSVDVLVALRTKVTNTEAAAQEQGYRLRVTMQRDNGTYKIAKLVQVTT
jgi:Mce-associated membrane protein